MSIHKFKLVGRTQSQFDSDDIVRLELEVNLPNDGTPTNNMLVVCIEVDQTDPQTAEVSLVSRTSKDTTIMTKTVPVRLLGNILYSSARVVSRDFLEIQ